MPQLKHYQWTIVQWSLWKLQSRSFGGLFINVLEVLVHHTHTHTRTHSANRVPEQFGQSSVSCLIFPLLSCFFFSFLLFLSSIPFFFSFLLCLLSTPAPYSLQLKCLACCEKNSQTYVNVSNVCLGLFWHITCTMFCVEGRVIVINLCLHYKIIFILCLKPCVWKLQVCKRCFLYVGLLSYWLIQTYNLARHTHTHTRVCVRELEG